VSWPEHPRSGNSGERSRREPEARQRSCLRDLILVSVFFLVFRRAVLRVVAHGRARRTCTISDDAGVPKGFNPFFPNWVCYEGGWRRYDTRCLGE
jgi:hypothetical protein